MKILNFEINLMERRQNASINDCCKIDFFLILFCINKVGGRDHFTLFAYFEQELPRKFLVLVYLSTPSNCVLKENMKILLKIVSRLIFVSFFFYDNCWLVDTFQFSQKFLNFEIFLTFSRNFFKLNQI